MARSLLARRPAIGWAMLVSLAFAGQAPGSQSPQPAASSAVGAGPVPALTTASTSSPIGGPLCAPGAPLLTTPWKSTPFPPTGNCGPVSCEELASLPWGIPNNGPSPDLYRVQLPKFDRAEFGGGVLTAVEVRGTLQVDGSAGWEHLGLGCFSPSSPAYSLLFRALAPDGLNDPPLSLGAPLLEDQVQFSFNAKQVGAFDGILDFAGFDSQLPCTDPLNGSGYSDPWSRQSSPSVAAGTLDPAPWSYDPVASPQHPQQVTLQLETLGVGYDAGIGGFNVAFRGLSEGDLLLEVRYEYCENQGPSCPNPCPGVTQVPEDFPQGVLVDVLACVSDPEGDGIEPSTLVVVGAPAHGTATVVQDASFPSGWGVRYVPTELNYCGPDEFSFTVADVWGQTTPQPCRAQVEVTPVNDPPVAVADPDASTGEPCFTDRNDGATPILLPVCANDFDPDELNPGCGALLDCSTIQLLPASVTFDPPYSGSYTLVPSNRQEGSFELLLGDPFYCGELSFRYRVRDAAGALSNPAPVQVCLYTNNNPPVAVADDYCGSPVLEDTPFVDLPVVANDSDPDTFPCGFELDACQLRIVAQPTVGTVQVCGQDPAIPSGHVRYFPPPGFCGDGVTFSYEVSDGDLWSGPALVTLCVAGVNDPPVALDDVETTDVDVPVVVAVLENDSDPDSAYSPPCGAPLDPTTVQITTPPSCEGGAMNATAVPLPSGEVLFTPPPGFIGVCTFGYKVSDTLGVPSNEAVVTVIIEQSCVEVSRRRGASLLVFPEYDNRPGQVTVVTVTNTSNEQGVRAEFTYRSGLTCAPFTRLEELTPNDTFSAVTGAHYPTTGQGYLTVAARCPESTERVVFNHLVGNELVLDGFEGAFYSLNALDFRGIGLDADGVPGGTSGCGFPLTDLDGDGLLDLDGMEYDPAPDQILIPRFLGQSPERTSHLVLLDFTGRHFTTRVDLLVYNDNEEVFSAQHTFQCWDRLPLSAISSVFNQDYLANATAQDPLEVLGDPSMESGWIRLDGGLAQSGNGTQVEDPAFYAVLVDLWEVDHLMSALPFERCSQENGALLSGSLDGDQD